MKKTPNPSAGGRINHALLGAGAAIALIAFALLRGGGSPAAKPRAEERAHVEASETRVAVTKAPPKPSAQAAARPPAPVIDEVVLEKKEVCRGEENLVTVKAHTVDGTDAEMRVLVAGLPGDRVPVRLHESRALLGGKPAPRPRIIVLGSNGATASVELPHYVVKECREQHSVYVEPRLLTNTWGRYALEARVVDAGGEPLRPVSYRWTFGDGTSATTTDPRVDHDYEGRPQGRLDTNTLVSVEARDASGRTARGRVSLPLHNPAYEAWAKKGIVQLLVTLDPRLPEMGEDGVVRESVRLRHIHDGAVRLDRIIATEVRMDGTESMRDVPPASLGLAEIPAGEGAVAALSLDTHAQPELMMIRYDVAGTTPEGDPVMGAFAVMRPTPAPTRERSEPVTDAKLIARIKLAKAILHRPVTDDDLARLAREGAFAELEAADQRGRAID